MTKKIEDYLHLYMGCEVEFGYEDRKKRGQLIGKTGLGWQVDEHRVHSPIHAVRDELIKPILRPLADMTEDEAIGRAVARGYKKEHVINLKFHGMGYEFGDLDTGTFLANSGPYMSFKGEEIHYLLSRHFDLFGLIDAGLAINKIDIK